MLKKLKDFLGIEGVKIDMTIPAEVDSEEGVIDGHIILNSKSTQKVKSIEIRLMEKYSRGRGEKKLINEYLLGLLEIVDPFVIEKDEEKRIQFSLEFVKMMSEMDKFERDNLIYRGFVKLAKTLKRVKSDYRVEARVRLSGVSTTPIIEKAIRIR